MKFKLGALSSLGISANTIIMGVVVESSGLKRSSNGKDYAVWHLSDLKVNFLIKMFNSIDPNKMFSPTTK